MCTTSEDHRHLLFRARLRSGKWSRRTVLDDWVEDTGIIHSIVNVLQGDVVWIFLLLLLSFVHIIQCHFAFKVHTVLFHFLQVFC